MSTGRNREAVLQVRFPLPKCVKLTTTISHHIPRPHYSSSPVLCLLLILFPLVSFLIPKYLKGLCICYSLCLEYLSSRCLLSHFHQAISCYLFKDAAPSLFLYLPPLHLPFTQLSYVVLLVRPGQRIVICRLSRSRVAISPFHPHKAV